MEVAERRETLYLRNLNEKVSINKLKAKLEALFSTYGNVIQITAHKNLRMKGQAFVTFENILEATNALNKLQDFIIFEKPVKIKYSEKNSDNFHYSVSKQPEQVEKRKLDKVVREETIKKRKLEEANKQENAHEQTPTSTSVPSFDATPAKSTQTEDWKSLPPNNILLIQGLPSSITKEFLEEIFQTEDGFISVRYVKIRNLAFVEFDTEELSTKILNKYNAELLSKTFEGSVLFTYAKK